MSVDMLHMKPLPLILLTSLALPLAAVAQNPVSSAIRSFLPDAKKSEAQQQPAPAVQEPAPAPEEKKELPPPAEYSPDTTRAENTSPTAHPDAYKDFVSRLDEQVSRNLEDFCPALSAVLTATHDEFAAEEWMLKAAADGNAAAMQYAADIRLRQIPKDKLQSPEIKEAYRLVRQSMAAGFHMASVNAYICLRNGIGTEKNEEEAEKVLFEACKGGGFVPRFKWLQYTGRLTQFDDRERPEVKAEIDRGNHHVIYYLAMMAPTAREQMEWMQKAALQGNSDAIFALSAFCSQSKPKQSYDLLQQAIKRHNAEAMFTLGMALTDINSHNPLLKEAGISPDDKTGRHLLRLASMLGSVTANFTLGSAYYEGKFGINPDPERAYRHFEQGARNGHAPCGAAQGLLLLLGKGVTPDTKRGILLIRGAANAGYPYAVVLLAYAHYKGLGVPADAEKAMTLLQEAAAMGFPQAYVYMAYISAHGGNNVSADAAQADKYVRMAALDMKDAARKLYDELQSAPEWVPHP